MNKFLSRKFIVTLIGIVINGLAVQYPEYREVLTQLNALIAAYVVGQSYVDGKQASNEG